MTMKVLEDGRLQGETKELVAYLMEMVPLYDNHSLKNALEQVNKLMRSTSAEIAKAKANEEKMYQIECYAELTKVRRLIYYRLGETAKFNTTAPVPNNLIQNLIATNELVKTFGEILDYSGGGVPVAVSGIEMSETFQNQLAKPETHYIIDAIGYYVDKYRKAGGNTPEIQYHPSEEWDSYMITDTFDNICNNCRADGQIRKSMKAVLFGKERPLQYVTLFLPIDKKRKAYKKVQFINAVIEEGMKMQPGGWYANEDNPEEVTKIGRVVLQVSAKLYKFLEPQYANRQKEDIDLVSGGYHMRPLAFSENVKNMFEQMRLMADTAYKEVMHIDMTGFDSQKGLTAVTYIMQKWNKGLENRATNMVVTHKELEERGYLPAYSHKSNAEKQAKKYRDVDAISRVIAEIIRVKTYQNSFPKCTGAGADKENLSVVLLLEQEEFPPQTP